MANSTIKRNATARAGYEFQDLVGIETLIRFYREPHLFGWVMLEADVDEYEALDDVVASRADGSFEYTQVKFTVDEGTYFLDWDWLLEKTKRGTTKLHKWAQSLKKVRALGPLHSACLRTNRMPSPAFRAAMRGQRVDLASLDKDLRLVVENECGGATDAASFFGDFEFQSISENLDRLEARVKMELVPADILSPGWSTFRDQVRRWSIKRDEPPGGKILYHHLAQIITRQRPAPIRQDFRIPPGYGLPSLQFHQDFISRIVDPTTPVTILWGTPGRGKSTYLSYLTDELRRQGKAVVRHHYFLSGDDTSDRISYAEISHSLISQLLDRYPEAVPAQIDNTVQLHSILSAAANYFEEKGERLYVLVDGLDHVWRDYNKIDQLNFLFNQLLPLPQNVTLVVGTQRVPNGQLPTRLLSASTESDWILIPPMDTIAVHHWIDVQDKAGRLILHGEQQGAARAETVAKISDAFFSVSQGHPLHIIYAFESLTGTGAPVTAENVLHVPQCPDGDIRKYYGSLWDKLSDTGREILHALAGSEFHWPSLGIRQCLGNYDEISFLLDARESGILPFHGSLLAYVRDRHDHSEKFQALLPRIVTWLENLAPPFWRWGWLWLSKAKLGDFEPIMRGVSREWAVSSLAEGWPERQVARIFKMAEERAFRTMDFPRAIELRSVKIRVMNAREFQIQDYAAFEQAAIGSAENWQQLRNMFDDLPALTDTEVAMLPRAARDGFFDEVVTGCEAELARRIDTWLELRHRSEGEFVTLAHLFLDVCALSPKLEVEAPWNLVARFRDPSTHITYFGERLAAARNYDALLELRDRLGDEDRAEERCDIEANILRVACALGADPFARTTLSEGSLSPIYAAWSRLHAPSRRIDVAYPAVPKNMVRERYDYGIDLGLRNFIHALFFSALAHSKSNSEATAFEYPGLKKEELGWLAIAFDVIEEIARKVARGDLPADLSSPFIGASALEPIAHGRNRATESDQAQYRSFVAALRQIAFDLHLIGTHAGRSLVDSDVLERARSSPHWSDELWMVQVAAQRNPTMTYDAANVFLEEDAEKLGSMITVFNERTEAWTLRARVALTHDLPLASTLAKRAADCLLGYGYRKDPWIFDILGAVEAVHDPVACPALGWISVLVPIVDQIGEFTDGSYTTHARSEIIKVTAETYPERLAAFFRRHVEDEEWTYADECLRQITGVSSLQTPEVKALVGTFLDRRVLSALEARSRDNSDASLLLEQQMAFLGGMPADHSDHYHSSKLDDEHDLHLANHGPHDFGAVVADASGIFSPRQRSRHFGGWLQRQKAKGKGKEALDSIRKYFNSGEPHHNAEDALDAAFSVSLEVEGRKAAYDWLVRAHIARHGWSSNWTSRDEVMNRLRLAAEHYGDDWQRFIFDTAEPQEFYRKLGHGLTIGTTCLVEFLLLVDQHPLAAKIVDSMVKTIVDEVHDQPIPEAPWFQ